MDIVERRQALAAALTAHDTNGVKLFLHPSFVLRGTDGIALMDNAEFLRQLPAFFNSHPEYQQSVEIEASKMDGDSATLSTKRVERLRALWRSHSVCSHWNELWRRVDGEWVLAEESPSPPYL